MSATSPLRLGGLAAVLTEQQCGPKRIYQTRRERVTRRRWCDRTDSDANIDRVQPLGDTIEETEAAEEEAL